MSDDPEGPKSPPPAADPARHGVGDRAADPAEAGRSGCIVATPDVLTKQGSGADPSPEGPGGPKGPTGPGGVPTDRAGEPAGTGERPADRADAKPVGGGAVILPFPMDRVRRSGPPRGQKEPAALAPLPTTRTANPAETDLSGIEPRSAEDWRLAAAIMADAEAQAVRNAALARESQARMREAADAFQRTQATAAEVRRTLAGQNVQGLRDSAAKLRETVAWMDRVLGDLER